MCEFPRRSSLQLEIALWVDRLSRGNVGQGAKDLIGFSQSVQESEALGKQLTSEDLVGDCKVEHPEGLLFRQTSTRLSTAYVSSSVFGPTMSILQRRTFNWETSALIYSISSTDYQCRDHLFFRDMQTHNVRVPIAINRLSLTSRISSLRALILPWCRRKAT